MIWWILGAFALFLIFVGAKAVTGQVAQVAQNAGFSGEDLVTAVAIAYAESSGNPKAVGDNGTSYGLWQIHWTVHRELYVSDPQELFDPQINANAAFTLYQRAGSSFRDWSTYNSGVYANYVDQANTEVSG